MGLLVSLLKLFSTVRNIDTSVKTGFKFSQEEIKEIVSSSKKENLKYFEVLCKIPNLKTFDISFLLTKTELDNEKIAIIQKAQALFDEKEFKEQGQTLSDFIFKVAANLKHLNLDNIEVFKELAKCKNDIYDFKKALENPNDYLSFKQTTTVKYAFEQIYIN